MVVLPGGINYNIMVNAGGYNYHIKNIDVPVGGKYSEVNDTICLLAIKEGTFMGLRAIVYEGEKLAEASHRKLNRLVQMMSSNPEMNICINVYTDSDGDEHLNQELTEGRAKSVRDYLVSRGIPSVRIHYKGFGEAKPIAPNDTPENKSLNRRTEVEILK